MKFVTSFAFAFLIFLTNGYGQDILQGKLLWAQIGSSHLVNARSKAIITQKNTAFIFVSPECPLCKNYMLTLNILSKKYPQVNIVAVVPGKSYTLAEIKQFGESYNAAFDIYLDENKTLTKMLKAKVTPETIVIDAKGNIRYRGLIDNWQVKLGVKRKIITDHYLDDALKEINATTYKCMETSPMGCLINDL